MRNKLRWKWMLAITMVLWCTAGVMNYGTVGVQAEEYGDYEYTVLDDGTVEISGYNGSDTEITIPSVIDGKSVTSIGDQAFFCYSGLNNIEIPSSVTSIGKLAFYGCSNLSSVKIPANVTSIEDSAFASCSSLNSIKVDEENEIYDSRNNCNAIIKTSTNTLIVGCNKTLIPVDVTSIGNKAFSGCSTLSSIEIPTSIKAIGFGAFEGCSSLSAIKIPEYVTSIEYGTFFECSNLNIVEIPASITSIERYAFYGCSNLSSVEIPANVTSIEDSVFAFCSSLNSIKVDTKNKIYDSRNNCNAIIETSTGTLIRGCNNTIIPESITTIGTFAFSNCSSLSSIEIPESITSIGYDAFYGCGNLNSINVDEKNEIYDSRNNCNAIIETSTDTLIRGCTNTIIPESVTSIGGGAFSACNSLSSIEIPKSVTSIGEWSFYGCSNLSNIEIPASVAYIEFGSFEECPTTMIITTEKGAYAADWAIENGYQVKYIGETSPSDDEYNEKSEPLSEEDTEKQENPSQGENTETPTPSTEDNPTTKEPTTETPTTETPAPNPSATEQSTDSSVTNPAKKGSVLQVTNLKCKVKVLSDNATSPTVEYTGTINKKSKTVKIPDTITVDGVTYKVTKVSNNAFSGNKNITSVTIGKNVTSIGKNAFKNCTKLKSVNIKSTTLNQIGANAFSGDKKLMKITLKTTKLTKKSVGKNALRGTNKKLVIKVPKKKVSAYKKYFKGKGNKTVTVKK